MKLFISCIFKNDYFCGWKAAKIEIIVRRVENIEIKIINEILIFLLEDICEVVIGNFEPKRD